MTAEGSVRAVRPGGGSPSDTSEMRMMDVEASRPLKPQFGDLRAWLVRSLATVDDDPYDCSTALDVLTRMADRWQSVRVDDTVRNGALRHMHSCRHCADVYHTLLALVDLENTGALPDVEDLLHTVHCICAPDTTRSAGTPPWGSLAT